MAVFQCSKCRFPIPKSGLEFDDGRRPFHAGGCPAMSEDPPSAKDFGDEPAKCEVCGADIAGWGMWTETSAGFRPAHSDCGRSVWLAARGLW